MKNIEIYEHDHFYKQYEDYKNNLYMLLLNNDIEKWIEENIGDIYDIDCENYYTGNSNNIIILFKTEEDAMAFKLRWL